MAEMRVTFTRLVQRSQVVSAEASSDQDHLIARVYFDLEAEGQVFADSYVEVTQPLGTDFATEPFQVRHPVYAPYQGPFPREEFAAVLDAYCRRYLGKVVPPGSRGSGIRLYKNNHILTREGPHTFVLPEESGDRWWTIPPEFVPLPKPSTHGVLGLVEHIGKTFTDTPVVLDGQWFKECTFIRCKMIIRAERGFDMTDCIYEQNDWHLEAAAERTISMLTAVYHGSPLGQKLVEDIFDGIRRA